ncbi:hypothetical protein GS399_03330 [Pedobacter sp. HMF7647]|uniref:Chemotaxis methyl-accepting receptor HlyB-like 4HB MCP domain-containing protein n=2 Tax=Hufsiella arboris TaxID=2695275 RepID=A0A7K1Y6C4_9SPHI|nr:hypothetical protein [Hufsiella arboris]
MSILILGNLWYKKTFSTLGDNVTSILNDRLKPSNYLYQISNKLHDKRFLLQEPRRTDALDQSKEMDYEIKSLTKAYELTTLTSVEKKEWQLFKQHLNEYNSLEKNVYSHPAQADDTKELDLHYRQTLAQLDKLSNIQLGVGNELMRDSHSVLSDSVFLSKIELVALIALGLLSLIILSASDKRLFRQEKYHLN